MTIRCRALIFNHQGELFVVKHVPGQSFWATPGGKLEQGENTKQCVERELHEELDIKEIESKLVFIVEAPHINSMEFFFLVMVKDPENLVTQNGEDKDELADRAFMFPSGNGEKILPEFLMNETLESLEAMTEPRYIYTKK